MKKAYSISTLLMVGFLLEKLSQMKVIVNVIKSNISFSITESSTLSKARTTKKTKKETILNHDSLQQILIKTNGELVEPMHIVLASPIKSQQSTISYSPIAPATNKKHSNESSSSSSSNWMTTSISQKTKNAQALALKAVARNQIAKINQQQQQRQMIDNGKIK